MCVVQRPEEQWCHLLYILFHFTIIHHVFSPVFRASMEILFLIVNRNVTV